MTKVDTLIENQTGNNLVKFSEGLTESWKMKGGSMERERGGLGGRGS